MAKSPMKDDEGGTDTETAPAPKLVPVLIKRDFWAGENYRDQWGEYGVSPDGSTARVPAGNTFNLTRADYLRMVASGAVERNDPLPGDE